MEPADKIDWTRTAALVAILSGLVATITAILKWPIRRALTWCATEVLTDKKLLRKYLDEIFADELALQRDQLRRIEELERDMAGHREEFQKAARTFAEAVDRASATNREAINELTDSIRPLRRALQTLVAIEAGPEGLRKRLLEQFGGNDV